jgi:cytochrome c biogenesis protein CcdA
MTELETASSKDLSDVQYAKTILRLSDLHYTNWIFQEIESVPSGSERVIEKRAVIKVIKVLLLSTWLQRIYFIIRSFLMASISSLITIGFVSYFGTIGTTLAIIIGMIVFVVSLVITRLFDMQIVEATKSIVVRLDSHRTVRDFIMNHF